MKGLRHILSSIFISIFSIFLPCDLNEGITTRQPILSAARFNLLPEWRDYDPILSAARFNLLRIFTLWPEWRDYDSFCSSEVSWTFPLFNFYLVTWMKGLRLVVNLVKIVNSKFPFLPCDLNEGITTLPRRCHTHLGPKDFYLVTWMKGLRLFSDLIDLTPLQVIFTLWPEWRDYDS